MYYSLNTSYPLFNEMKSIVTKTIGVPITIKSALKKIKGIKQVFIYGSFAKNERKHSSDIDILIIGNVDENKLIKVLKKLEHELQREINYSLYSESDFKKKKKAKDPFILEVLRQPKIFLVGNVNEL